MGFQRKRWKISKVTYTAIQFLLLTTTNTTNNNKQQQNKEFVSQILYLMVLLCVIFKRVWYARRFECSCKRCSCSTENNLQTDFKKLHEKMLTINKKNKIRWNTYRDNNFHLRRQVLRLKCLLKILSHVRFSFFFFKVNSLAEYLFYKPAFQYLLFFEMNSRQGNRSKLSFYQQNYN